MRFSGEHCIHKMGMSLLRLTGTKRKNHRTMRYHITRKKIDLRRKLILAITSLKDTRNTILPQRTQSLSQSFTVNSKSLCETLRSSTLCLCGKKNITGHWNNTLKIQKESNAGFLFQYMLSNHQRPFNVTSRSHLVCRAVSAWCKKCSANSGSFALITLNLFS